MNNLFQVHTKETASTDGVAALTRLHEAVGILPNLAAAMAESPALLNGFLDLRERYAQAGFSAAEIQILSLVAAYENRCSYCVAFHTAMARKEGVSSESVDRLRNGKAPVEAPAGALSEFARTMVKEGGNVGGDAMKTFLDAGFTQQQALGVVLGMAFSVLANYAGNLIEPPLDAFLEPHAWQA